MTRQMKILRNAAIGLAAFLAVALIAAILVVQTDWFRNYVRQKIITATEDATGAKVELGSFAFEWQHLRATVTDFVIHGDEPAGAAPLMRVSRVQVDLRLLTSIRRFLDLAYLGVDRPEANILVYPDGRTNIPTPKKKSNTTALETVVDLAVRHFELANGLLVVNSRKQPFNIRANNLRAQFWYGVVRQAYQGELSMQPVYVASGQNTPVDFTVTLPVAVERDRIDFHNARITTPASALTINGSIGDLRNPIISADLNGHIALADLKKIGDLQLGAGAPDAPSVIELSARGTVSDNTIRVSGLRLGLGDSTLEASGALKDPKGNGTLAFQGKLALGELGRLANVAAQPTGTARVSGTARLDQGNNYQIAGNIAAEELSFKTGTERIRNINLFSGVRADPHRVELNGLRVTAFGGEFAGNASLQDFALYKVNGALHNFDLQAAARAAGQAQLPYDGIVSGPVDAEGNLEEQGMKGLKARARIDIRPGVRGVPVSGHLEADYNGKADVLGLRNSFLSLPHTRLNLSGNANRVDINLVTRDLNDLFAALPPASRPAVVLNGGQSTFAGTLTGGLRSPRIAGHVDMNRFSVEGRQFDQLTADVAASKSNVNIQNGGLNRNGMQARYAASVGLNNWKTSPNSPVTANATIQNGDLADMLVLGGQPASGYSGALNADLQVGGTTGNPSGSARLQAANGSVRGEPFDRIEARVDLTDQLVTIPSASIAAGTARVNLTAEFQHPRDGFRTGRLHAHVQSSEVNLTQIRTLQKERPNTAGSVQINADVTGNLSEVKSGGAAHSEFLLTAVDADASAKALRFEGQDYGELNATARTSGQTVNYNVASDFAGSNIRASGSTQLVRDYPTVADAKVGNLPIERLLPIAGRKDIPAKGNLSGTAHFSGTAANPQGKVDLDLAKAELYGESIDHVRANVSYLPNRIDASRFEVVSGGSHVELAGSYDHPAGDLQTGKLNFHVTGNRIDLARIQNLQKVRPGLGGRVQIAADGTATVRQAEPKILFQDVTANIGAAGITIQNDNLGDVTLTANTTSGHLNFALDSNLAGASIHGRGGAQLGGDYPMDAQLTFNNLTWLRLRPLVSPAKGGNSTVDVASDGQITVNGPVLKTDQIRGSVRLTRLQADLSMRKAGAPGDTVVIQNQDPVSVALDKGSIRIESAHFTGKQTDIRATGTVSLQKQTLDLTINANANLALLQNINRDFYSSGDIVLGSTVHGTISQPLVNGQLELKNATVNYANLPNGISNANGLVMFNGNSASIRNLTAESGGGKLTLAGFASFRQGLRFGLRGTAENVRVKVQQGVSVVADANLNVSGIPENSLATGTITITQVNYTPKSDFGSILTRAAPPVQAPSAPSPILEGMKLDINVRTSSAMLVQASLAQNVQANADVRIRGTAAQPGAVGRINISEGQLTFFGATYTVNSGTISFFNPLRIDPILDISLETQVRGVNVTLTVAGPVDNMKLSYTSDPPLQFQEIISLLASGRTPTSDPNILASQPSQPPQSFEGMGESALIGKALADPVAGQLQRVFGVSQLSIDPTFTSGWELPQARISLQQRISNNVTFTYVTALNGPNTQIIQAEWAMNQRWSALATRDQNGIVNITLFYKKQFR